MTQAIDLGPVVETNLKKHTYIILKIEQFMLTPLPYFVQNMIVTYSRRTEQDQQYHYAGRSQSKETYR
jgi:hypothetical protein